MSEILEANLLPLIYPHAAGSERRRVTLFGGGERTLNRPAVLLSSVAVHEDSASQGVTLTAIVPGAAVSVIPRAIGLPESWRGALCLIFDVEAPVDSEPFTLFAGVSCVRSRIIRDIRLDAGTRTQIVVQVFEMPLATGIAEPDHPESIDFWLQWTSGETSRQVVLHGIGLERATAEDLHNRGVAIEPCLDRYGQRRFSSWQGKINNDMDLDTAREAEVAEQSLYQRGGDNDSVSLFPGRNMYGGFRDVGGFESSGFFRVEQDAAGVWWFVDPCGQPFWSHGVTGVRTHRGTPVVGREYLYQELPSRDGRYAESYVNLQDGFHQPVLSFYRLNALRKYGTLRAWADATLNRLKTWGINTLGNWSEEIVNEQQRIPSVASIRSIGSSTPRAGRFPDVFDPDWSIVLDERLAAYAARHKDNPWLLGYFIDNELPWSEMNLLEASEQAAVRDVWVQVVREKVGELSSVNSKWGAQFTSWSQIAAMTPKQLDEIGPAVESARIELETRFAEVYFSKVSALLARHDPNHLYLGCRFVRKLPPRYIVAAAGRYASLLTVNCYALFPDREQFHMWHEWSGGLPILIGEHHLSGKSERGFPPLFPAFTPAERERYYKLFVQQWASQPWSLGCHWFQYTDQVLTGRDRDGENQLIGLADITDNPYPEMERAVRSMALQIYSLHSNAIRHTLQV